MGSGYSQFKKQARAMQEQFLDLQDHLKKIEVSGQAGNGLVKVVISGEKELKKIEIHPECLSDVEGLQDLILASYQNALSLLEAQLKKEKTTPSQFF